MLFSFISGLVSLGLALNLKSIENPYGKMSHFLNIFIPYSKEWKVILTKEQCSSSNNMGTYSWIPIWTLLIWLLNIDTHLKVVSSDLFSLFYAWFLNFLWFPWKNLPVSCSRYQKREAHIRKKDSLHKSLDKHQILFWRHIHR